MFEVSVSKGEPPPPRPSPGCQEAQSQGPATPSALVGPVEGDKRGKKRAKENRGSPGTNLVNETEGRGGERTMEKGKTGN